MIGDVAEHDHAQDRDEHEQRIAVGLHGTGLGIVERLDQRVMRQRAQRGDGEQQRPTFRVRPDPLPRSDQRRGAERHEGRPDERGIGRVGARAEADQDLVAAPQDGARHRQQQRPVELAKARSHDQQDADEARADSSPARRARTFAEEQHAQRDHDQRRSGGDGVCVGQRQVAEGQHEHRALDHRQQGTAELQPWPRRARRRAQAAPAHDRPSEQAEDAVAHPHHLADRIVGHHPLADGVHAGEAQHGEHREDRAARRVVATEGGRSRCHSGANSMPVSVSPIRA